MQAMRRRDQASQIGEQLIPYLKMKENHKDHAALAGQFNKDEARVDWHDQTLWWVRQKRDKAAQQIPEWESLRDLASGIKDNVLSHLSEYLLQFEEQARLN